MQFNLPFWADGQTLQKLKSAAQQYWEYVQSWFENVSPKVDAEQAPISLVNLLAWQRLIERIPNEPESLYRLRVKYARENMQDAGSVAGLKRIFDRLELHIIDIEERLIGQDWDIVSIQLQDTTLNENANLIASLIRNYGLTCRRYQYSIVDAFTTFTGQAVNAFEHAIFTIRDQMAVEKTDTVTVWQYPTKSSVGFAGQLDNVVAQVKDQMEITQSQSVELKTPYLMGGFNNQSLTVEG